MDIKCDLRVRERPHMVGDILHVSVSEGTTARYVVTDDFIAVDYLCDGGRVDWYFYLNGWKAGWEELSNEQRLMVRINLNEYVNIEDSMWNPGEYSDSRYYTLEGLEVA